LHDTIIQNDCDSSSYVTGVGAIRHNAKFIRYWASLI